MFPCEHIYQCLSVKKQAPLARSFIDTDFHRQHPITSSHYFLPAQYWWSEMEGNLGMGLNFLHPHMTLVDQTSQMLQLLVYKLRWFFRWQFWSLIRDFTCQIYTIFTNGIRIFLVFLPLFKILKILFFSTSSIHFNLDYIKTHWLSIGRHKGANDEQKLLIIVWYSLLMLYMILLVFQPEPIFY